MKINYEDYLHKIDLALKNKTQKELYMTYIMVVVGIFAFSYLLFWDSSFESFENTRKNVANLENKIAADKRFLQMNPASKITQLDTQIKRIKDEVAQIKDTNEYIKSKIETISSLIYDEKSWGEYLDSIATNAQKYHVQLLNLKNQYAKANSDFGHMLDIYVVSTGEFHNTLKFMNALEQSNLVVDIHDFKIDANDSLQSDLNISVWGITY